LLSGLLNYIQSRQKRNLVAQPHRDKGNFSCPVATLLE
jgi:hypothetical protein